ncbi:MAG: PEP-CTERM sorting domain-containing protein [Betaproteobacteria bacterium]|nr:PEP-CTERM sorting domain-containing protein [Betaproteobacteria bacterium]
MMAMARLFTSVAAAGILTVTSLCGMPPASAAQFGGVEFPQGMSSFADVVQSFDPAIVSGEPTAPHLDANKALGAPGGNIESTSVDISKDGGQWNAVGKISGGTRGIDLDFFGWSPTDLFSFVRLTDDRSQGATTGESVGADIDAVGAISSVPASVPEPTASSLLVAALALAWLFTSRLRSGAGAPGPRPAPA